MKIMVFRPNDIEGGVYLYRVRQPMEELERRGHEIVWVGGPSWFDIARENMKDTDIIFWSLFGGKTYAKMVLDLKNGLNPARKKAGLKPIKLIVDFDDNIIHSNPYSDSYRYGGTEEVTVTLGSDITAKVEGREMSLKAGTKYKIWEDGKAGFDIARNKRNKAYTLSVIKNADCVTTTTPIIAGLYYNYNRNVEILPNAIDFRKWRYDRKPARVSGEIRIGWHGGASHYVDWATIAGPLKRILRRHPNTKLVLLGQSFREADIPKKQLEFHEWVPIDAFPLKMTMLNIDIALIPLAENDFNVCKSPLKFFEYSALKVPSVVSAVPPYVHACEHGRSALMYESGNEFCEALERLILSPTYRKEIAENAYWDILKNCSVKRIADDYEVVFRNQINKEEKVPV